MVKLPKEMQKKEKARPRRPQKVVKREGTSQFSSRQMRRKMKQQGIDLEQIEAERVIIEQPHQTLVIEEPEIVLMKQGGQEIYQIIGNAEPMEPEQVIPLQKEEGLESKGSPEETELKPTITEEDIMLVAAQSKVDKKEAEAALIETNGDIAKAILLLKNRI
ncbi:MAG: nascent polypeptide-associated complex protein [Promethearchaeota archaeon]